MAIYLDYAATTPIAPEVRMAMEPYLTERFGNAGSVHTYGQEAMGALDRSRETVARATGAEFSGVIFTGSASEANNLALRGVVRRYLDEAPRRPAAIAVAQRLPRIIVSAIEHDSVLETARDLESRGEAELVLLPVDQEGVTRLERLMPLLDERTALVSVMSGSNEVGSIQPIREISELLRARRAPGARYPLLHTDAAQAFAYLPCRLGELGVDLLTLSAHKARGPKGVGALIVRLEGAPPKTLLAPLVTGGGQEYGLRAGSENVAAIVGFAAAVERAEARRNGARSAVTRLAEFVRREVTRRAPELELNGPSDILRSLPHIANLRLPGRSAELTLVKLDRAGIAVSAGSACSARMARASHVLLAMGRSAREARESIRMSFGEETTEEEVARALHVALEAS